MSLETNTDPDASEEAVPKGEGRAELPFLLALRQDVPGRHSGPCLCTGEVQSGLAGRGWAELLRILHQTDQAFSSETDHGFSWETDQCSPVKAISVLC